MIFDELTDVSRLIEVVLGKHTDGCQGRGIHVFLWEGMLLSNALVRIWILCPPWLWFSDSFVTLCVGTCGASIGTVCEAQCPSFYKWCNSLTVLGLNVSPEGRKWIDLLLVCLSAWESRHEENSVLAVAQHAQQQPQETSPERRPRPAG